MFPSFVHTARHVMKVGSAGSLIMYKNSIWSDLVLSFILLLFDSIIDY